MIFYPKSLLNGSPIVSSAKFQVYLEAITNIKYKARLNWSAKVIASLGNQRFHDFRLLSLQTKFKKVLKEMWKRYIGMKILLTTKCIIYRGIKMSINCDITIIILTISLGSWYSSNLSWGHFLNEFNISFSAKWFQLIITNFTSHWFAKRHSPVVSALNSYLIVEVHRICSTEKVQQIRSWSFNMNTMQKDSSRFIIEHVFWKNASVNK